MKKYKRIHAYQIVNSTKIMTLKKMNVIASQVFLDKNLKVNAVGHVGKINNGKINVFVSNNLQNMMVGA